ncbi:MAG: hypothetical protein N2643_04210 [Endomicrobia bacterium]|nr:hypothetical protein [Endomicrobiia bacterium]
MQRRNKATVKFSSKKKTKKTILKNILYVSIIILFFLYLRQQYYVINLQNRIKQLYDEITVLENENKKLHIEKQRLLNEERLKTLAHKLKFVPITEKDILLIKYE